MNVQSISPSGAVVYWSVGPTDRVILNSKLDSLGLPHVQERSDASALSHAMKDFAEDHRAGPKSRHKILIRPNKSPKKNGYSAVDEQPDEERCHHTHTFTAKVVDGKVITSEHIEDAYQLQVLFEHHKAILPASAISKALVDILTDLGGICLRPGGSLYWIPGRAVSQWEAVGEAVKTSHEGNEVYRLMMKTDPETMRAVRDAIVREVNAEAQTIATRLAEGLGERGLETSRNRALALHDRITEYEGHLNATLSDLHQTVKNVEAAATLASLQLMNV